MSRAGEQTAPMAFRKTIIAPPGKLGLTVMNNKDKLGVLVSGVKPSSCLKDEVKIGDTILSLDGKTLVNVKDLTILLEGSRRILVILVATPDATEKVRLETHSVTAPPGRLGLKLDASHKIVKVLDSSSVKGEVQINDRFISVDGINVQKLTSRELVAMIGTNMSQSKFLGILRITSNKRKREDSEKESSKPEKAEDEGKARLPAKETIKVANQEITTTKPTAKRQRKHEMTPLALLAASSNLRRSKQPIAVSTSTSTANVRAAHNNISLSTTQNSEHLTRAVAASTSTAKAQAANSKDSSGTPQPSKAPTRAVSTPKVQATNSKDSSGNPRPSKISTIAATKANQMPMAKVQIKDKDDDGASISSDYEGFFYTPPQSDASDSEQDEPEKEGYGLESVPEADEESSKYLPKVMKNLKVPGVGVDRITYFLAADRLAVKKAIISAYDLDKSVMKLESVLFLTEDCEFAHSSLAKLIETQKRQRDAILEFNEEKLSDFENGLQLLVRSKMEHGDANPSGPLAKFVRNCHKRYVTHDDNGLVGKDLSELKQLCGGKPKRWQTQITERHEDIQLLSHLGFRWPQRKKIDPSNSNKIWDEMHDKLKSFKEKEGHCCVPAMYKDEDQVAIGRWVARQRKDYEHRSCGTMTKLDPEKIAKLDALGFVWKIRWGPHGGVAKGDKRLPAGHNSLEDNETGGSNKSGNVAVGNHQEKKLDGC